MVGHWRLKSCNVVKRILSVQSLHVLINLPYVWCNAQCFVYVSSEHSKSCAPQVVTFHCMQVTGANLSVAHGSAGLQFVGVGLHFRENSLQINFALFFRTFAQQSSIYAFSHKVIF